ncbi:hypothetical protein [Roseibium sp. RKSG952]|uniref:hypothetical protein n=1 Tax=Roseibium sp. RKSG952 TaxID=2529384 RepID=UPI0012BB76CA|nr:hypothetical protein [Roseibium sp. RKSG952]MTH95104.1 hypothetical protein [Roseibium sp. RKSG952]
MNVKPDFSAPAKAEAGAQKAEDGKPYSVETTSVLYISVEEIEMLANIAMDFIHQREVQQSTDEGSYTWRQAGLLVEEIISRTGSLQRFVETMDRAQANAQPLHPVR